MSSADQKDMQGSVKNAGELQDNRGANFNCLLGANEFENLTSDPLIGPQGLTAAASLA